MHRRIYWRAAEKTLKHWTDGVRTARYRSDAKIRTIDRRQQDISVRDRVAYDLAADLEQFVTLVPASSLFALLAFAFLITRARHFLSEMNRQSEQTCRRRVCDSWW